MKLYHLTEKKNINSILENGLKADSEGYVYLFDIEGKDIEYIAIGELGITSYALFEVRVDKRRITEDYTCETYPNGMYKHKGSIKREKVTLFKTGEVE